MLLKEIFSVILSYLLVILPGCGSRNQHTESTLYDAKTSSEVEALKKKNPSEIKKLFEELKGSLVEKLSASQVTIVDAKDNAITQKEMNENSGDLNQYFYKFAASKRSDGFALRVKTNLDDFEKNKLAKLTVESYNLTSEGKLDKKNAIVPAKTVSFEISDDFDKLMNDFERSVNEYATQVAKVVAKEGEKHGSVIQNILKGAEDFLFPTAYGQGQQADPTAKMIIGVLIGLIMLVGGVGFFGLGVVIRVASRGNPVSSDVLFYAAGAFFGIMGFALLVSSLSGDKK